MDTKQSVWKQIEEDKEDYRYFREHDQEKLRQTLDAVRKEHPLEKEQET